MRKFTSTEVAALLGVTEAYIRQVAAKEQGPEPEIANGRRFYTLEQVLELRLALAANGRKKWMNPRRTGDEQCQIVAVTNFKGGSSKTSTTIHLGHYLALRGYRVLAVDLDPQASLTALHGTSWAERIELQRHPAYGSKQLAFPRSSIPRCSGQTIWHPKRFHQ